MSSDEENNTPHCLVCNKEFDSKPWLIVYCDKNYHYGNFLIIKSILMKVNP